MPIFIAIGAAILGAISQQSAQDKSEEAQHHLKRKLMGRDREIHSGYSLWKSCPQMRGVEVDLLNRMIEQAQSINYRSFRRAVGGEQVDAWARDHGLCVGAQRDGPHIANAHYVGFRSSNWGHLPCYFIDWSHMEQVFLPVDEQGKFMFP